MKKNYSGPISILLLISITFLCTSYMPFYQDSDDIILEEGKYELVAKGNTELDLKGAIGFTSVEEISSEGTTYSTLNLRFKNDDRFSPHFFEFYITNTDISKPLIKGTYKISENIEGFIKDFKGVFGIADIAIFGELPFFTEKGQITIYHLEDASLSGRVDLTLTNTLGEIIEVSGDFVAAKEVF